MSGSVTADVEGRVCTITIENEGKRNAMDYGMADEVVATFEALEERDERAVVVVRGAGEQAFSAGFDLTVDRRSRSDEEKRAWPRMMDAIEGYDYPVIAMVNGDTYGGAVALIAACDIRIGVTEADFGVTPARIGLVYGGRAISRLTALVGPAKAKEMLFTANPIPAAHAAEIGLLNYAVARENLESRTYGMAEDMAGNAPFSLRKMKEITEAIAAKGRLSAAERKWIGRLREEAFRSEDHAEGVAAFQEGREPSFEDR